VNSLALEPYLSQLAQAFQQRFAQAAPKRYHLRVAELLIEVRLLGEAMAATMLPALGHLLIDPPPTTAPDMVFNLWDGGGESLWPPPPTFSEADYHRYGHRAIAHEGPCSVLFAIAARHLFAYDRQTRQGYFFAADASQLNIYEQAAPLQPLFCWALAAYGWQLVHAAAVGSPAGGVLLIGSSGAGKSTTALSCLTAANPRFLCDDKCLVRLTPEPQALALYSSAKLKADMLALLPHFRPLLKGWDDSGKANKGLVMLHPTYASQMVHRFPIKALLLPQVAHQTQASFHPVAPGEIFRQLGPSTVIWLPGAEADNYRFTAQLTRQLPRHRLALARDPMANAEAIHRLLEAP
jgi:hypothetical protein